MRSGEQLKTLPVLAAALMLLGGCGTTPSSADEALVKSAIQMSAESQAVAFAQRNPALMAGAATDAYYQQLVRTNAALAADDVSGLALVRLEWGPVTVSGDVAEAETFETWQTDYGSGMADQARDRNHYTLVRDGGWKIRSSLRPDSGLFQPEAPAASLASAPGGSAKSHNWSGYAARAGVFSAVAASWRVPRAAPDGTFAADSTWIGIGGMQSNDLIQAGTEQRVLASGKVMYDAWIETLPQPSQRAALNVSGGDAISASIAQQSDGSWHVALKDSTTGKSYQQDLAYQSSRASAEWIEEAPSGRRGGIMPLDSFGAVVFSSADATRDGQELSAAQAGSGGIVMIDRAGVPIAQPSEFGPDGSSFSVARLTAAGR